MLVKNWMSKSVVSIDADASMRDAVKLMKEHGIRMLPVKKNGKLVGIVSDRDLKRASASDATSLEIHELIYLLTKIKVCDIMTKNPITVPFDFTVEETAEILLINKISGAPVVDHNGEIVGAITQTDLFRVIISLTGVGRRGVQLALLLEDRPGSIKEVSDVIREYGGRIVSILSTHEGSPESLRKVYIRMYSIDRSQFEELIKTIREKYNLIYYVDHRENKRVIFEKM